MTHHDLAHGFLRSIALAAVLLVAGSLAARADLHLDITRGKIQPLPIAIPDFAGNQANEVQLGRDLTQVISADLERSGLFQPLDQRAFIEKITTNQTQPRFADWRMINAQALVTGVATMQPDGRARIEFRLWDVLAEQHLRSISGSPARTAISTPGSSTSRRAARPTAASSASRSWIRTAPITVS
jgi:TolB protein